MTNGGSEMDVLRNEIGHLKTGQEKIEKSLERIEDAIGRQCRDCGIHSRVLALEMTNERGKGVMAGISLTASAMVTGAAFLLDYVIHK